MSSTYKGLSDLLVINDKNLAERDISDLLNAAPLIGALAADTVAGTQHKYLRETGAPTVGFRAINAGLENSVSTEEAVSIDLKILGASFSVDKALADAYKDGPDAFLAREAARHLRAAFFMAEGQLLYGTGNEADGFEGLVDAIPFGSAMCFDAEGTTEGGVSQVFAIRTTGDLNNVVLLAGRNGSLDIAETSVIRMPGSGTTSFPAYYTPIEGWLGLQIGSSFSAGRIANITEESGKTLDDDMIAELLALFPSGQGATHLIMNRRSVKQLRASRTATNPTGAPAPFPVEAFNVPILVTDSVANTGSVEVEES